MSFYIIFINCDLNDKSPYGMLLTSNKLISKIGYLEIRKTVSYYLVRVTYGVCITECREERNRDYEDLE